jgi:ComF family protein
VNIIADFISLFYPKVCAACDGELLKGEEFICVDCQLQLPYTGFINQSPNAVEQMFWGRVELEAATAYLYFKKGNRTRKIMHRIKYKGEKELAEHIGKMMGEEMTQSERFKSIDGILPIPLHKKKQRKRGFNQSEWFAKGLAEKLNVEVITDVLLKTSETKSQTQKNRWQRWLNMGEQFVIKQPETIANKNILLVDDIVTTGATLEACTLLLKEETDCKISIATMAITE